MATRASAPRSGTGAAPARVVAVGSAGRAWRTAVLVALAAAFTAGSLVGDDDWWPFGPWRMFATSTPASGAVVVMAIEVRTAADPSWRPAPLTPGNVGLNRAEVEGRIPQVTADPARLGTLAAAHARLRPREPAWTGVRLVRRDAVLVDRLPTGEVRERVLAEWAG